MPTRHPAPRFGGRTVLLTAPAAGAAFAVGPSSGVASAEPLPSQLAETDRNHMRRVNLDRDEKRERVDVFNFAGAGAPVSGLMVCNRAGGEWRRVQVKRIVESPGSPDSGLHAAWVGDLNNDGRVEVAARDFLTPSAGEVLTILRQRTRFAKRFRKLQSVAGDVAEVVRHANAPETLSVVLYAHHATDGRRHDETWRWSEPTDQWICVRDCGGRAQRP